MIYDLRFTIVRGAREFTGSAGILPACGAAGNPETRRQDVGAPGEQYFFMSQSR
jgi:hypothetical protein